LNFAASRLDAALSSMATLRGSMLRSDRWRRFAAR
jgi:hypothetical protein